MTIKNEPLRLEIGPDGSKAGLYKGNLLVIGFKWIETDQVFEIITINNYYEDLMLHDKTMQGYLNDVLQNLSIYKKEAEKLFALKKGLEEISSIGPRFEIKG